VSHTAHSHLVGAQEMVEVVRLVVNHNRLHRMVDLETNKNHFDMIHKKLTVKVWMNPYIKSPFLRPSDAPG
jgi:hypothetical protein